VHYSTHRTIEVNETFHCRPGGQLSPDRIRESASNMSGVRASLLSSSTDGSNASARRPPTIRINIARGAVATCRHYGNVAGTCRCCCCCCVGRQVKSLGPPPDEDDASGRRALERSRLLIARRVRQKPGRTGRPDSSTPITVRGGADVGLAKRRSFISRHAPF